MSRRNLIDADVCEEISAALRHIRNNLRLSRREMAESTFVSASSIYNIENGIHVTKAPCHHLWIVYSDYFYNCMQDPNDHKLITNPTDIEHDLQFIETVLYDNKED